MTFPIFQFENGKAGFAGFNADREEAIVYNIFVVHLEGRPPLYGEWRLSFAPNGNDFDIEIVSFGSEFRESVGGRRIPPTLSPNERDIAKQLIEALVFSREAQESTWPFTSTKSRFLGHVIFRRGWAGSLLR